MFLSPLKVDCAVVLVSARETPAGDGARPAKGT